MQVYILCHTEKVECVSDVYFGEGCMLRSPEADQKASDYATGALISRAFARTMRGAFTIVFRNVSY